MWLAVHTWLCKPWHIMYGKMKVGRHVIEKHELVDDCTSGHAQGKREQFLDSARGRSLPHIGQEKLTYSSGLTSERYELIRGSAGWW